MKFRADFGIIQHKTLNLTFYMGAACAIAALVCLLILNPPSFIQGLDNMMYNVWLKGMARQKSSPTIAIVDIDEQSLKEYGQWPWPRYLLADLVSKILDSGAAAIGLDIILSEQDRSSPAWFGKNLAERFGMEPNLDDIPASLRDNDIFFRNTIKGKPVILGMLANLSGEEELPARLPPQTGFATRTPQGAPPPEEDLPKAHSLLEPLPLFLEAAAVGITNTSINIEGASQYVPLLVCARENIYASLSARTLMAALGKKKMRLDSDKNGLAYITIGKLKIPINKEGLFLPVFYGPGHTYSYYGAAEILSGKTSPDAFRDRIIFIGSTATGLNDFRSTSLDPAMPGVEIHATIADNILNGRHIIIPSWYNDIQICACILCALVTTLIFGFFSAAAYVPVALFMLGACFWSSWHLFERGYFLSPVYAVLAIALAGFIFLPVRFWHAEKGKREIKNAFARYVSPEVVSRIAAGSKKILGGEEKMISILFTDVRGFTTISEGLDPDRLVALLNSYFTPMTACVKSREGTLDKFIGDALMAFWNAPLDVKDHQIKAVEAAFAMQRALTGMGDYFRQNFNVEMRMGAGIHCGEVRVGNMGSRDLLNYTCIGDNVNLASRLEGLCKCYGVGIVVSHAIREACGERFQFRQLDRVSVKGSHRALEIYLPLDPELKVEPALETKWNNALNAYFAGDFAMALKGFAVIRTAPSFSVACSLFMDRCKRLMEQTGPAEWNGCWVYDTK